jgi:hypothetical protein
MGGVRCPECGRTVYWHRVYKTKAGVRAFCRFLPRRADVLEESAVDVWARLHNVPVRGDLGVQEELFT